MILGSNLHTHTTFCDGANSAEEMVLSAIKAGCHTLGFSGHSYIEGEASSDWVMSREGQKTYVEEINRLKRVYSDRINILLGIEQDYYSEPLTENFDYIIGSVHAVVVKGNRIDVDLSPDALSDGIQKFYGGNAMAFVKDYYALVADVVNKTKCDIIGHFDLITKFNEKYHIFDVQSDEYKKIAFEALDALIPENKLFEINTGAISRGWRTTPYPEGFILKRMAEKGAEVIITSDCHNKDNITFYFDEAVEYAKAFGIKTLNIYKGKNIEKILIREE